MSHLPWITASVVCNSFFNKYVLNLLLTCTCTTELITKSCKITNMADNDKIMIMIRNNNFKETHTKLVNKDKVLLT